MNIFKKKNKFCRGKNNFSFKCIYHNQLTEENNYIGLKFKLLWLI